MKKTNVYIDGFNLYYGIRKTPYRWLDPLQLCQRILHGRNIHRLRYFTARVKARGPDNSIIRRQQTYLRALQTLPNVEIHFGAFLVSRTRMKVASPHPGGPATVEVIKTEEKGSDVNIASYLLLDAFRRDVETAVIISNDSDLVTPIDLVRSEFGLDVIVLNPHKNPSAELRRAATMVHQIRKGVLGSSQFPPQLTDSRGIITKPALWDEHAWCEQCRRAHPSSLWANHLCPSCSSSRAVAWSVLRLSRSEYPEIPIRGGEYQP